MVNVTILILPLCLWLMAGICCTSALAQSVPFRSSSGQFTAWQLQRPASLAGPARSMLRPMAGKWAYLFSSGAAPALSNTEEITLDPALLVAQCERLKGRLLAELGEADQWQGRIDLIINPSLSEDKGPQLEADPNPQGWRYKLVLPKSVKQEILLRKLFQTLFLEMANRHATAQSAEIPLWLVEGMCARVQANNLAAFILQRGQSVSANIIWDKGSQTMPAALRQHAPLAFQQLSWPQESDLMTEGLPLYRSCAELFLEELLRFNDGRACLRSMIEQLPEHLNWQTAFLLAFHSHFDQLLDVEKWWSLSYVDFLRGYQAQAWSAADSRKTLQSCLDVPVVVHFDTDHMPVDAEITLQEVIRKWPSRDALDALQRAIAGLKFLEPRAAQEWRPLARLYLKSLLEYLKASQAAEREPLLGKHAPPLLNNAKAEAIKQLDALDRQREALWTGVVSTNLPQISASEDSAAKSAAGR
jgi:hypothetical protein